MSGGGARVEVSSVHSPVAELKVPIEHQSIPDTGATHVKTIVQLASEAVKAAVNVVVPE